MKPHVLSIGITLLIALASSGAIAQEELAPTPEEEPTNSYSLSIGAGMAKMDEDYFVRIRPQFEARIPNLRLLRDAPRLGGTVEGPLWVVLDAPLNINVIDRNESNGTFRSEDWDEISEYLAILRRFEFGTPNSAIYWRIGAQANATLGHGTIISNHLNTVDMDHRRFGAFVGVHAVRGGVEMYVDDLFKPFTIGGRMYARPWGAQVDQPMLSGIGFGFNFAVDPSAPLDLKAAGNPPTVPILDSTRYIETEREDAVGIIGFDAEVPFARFGDTRWTAFTDFNFQPGEGFGWHLGTFFGWKPGEAWVLEVDAEVQLLKDDYISEYFSWTYQASRFRPQQAQVDGIDDVGAGLRGRLALRHRDVGSLEVGSNLDFRDDAYADTFFARLSSPEDRVFRLAGVYALVRTDGFSGVNWWKDAWFRLEANYLILPYMSATASIGRRYRAEEGEAYRPEDDFFVGVRFHQRWNKDDD